MASFGQCEFCERRRSAEPEVCFECFREVIEPLDVPTACRICGHPLDSIDTCANPLCSRGDRYFSWNRALGTFEDPLRRFLLDYKYHEKPNGRARVLGRLLAQFLILDKETFRGFDFIIPSPTYLGPDSGGRAWDHIQFLVKQVAEHLPDWPIITDDRYIAKQHATPSMVKEGKTWAQRNKIATTQLRDALVVSQPWDLVVKSVLVIDDVFTDGQTLNEIARALRAAGALRVCGLTVARQVYRSR